MAGRGLSLSLLSVPSAAQSRGRLGLNGAKSAGRQPKHPGYSLFEWNKLCASGQDLAGLGGRLLEVSPDELARHNTESDCWTAVRGKVYNVTRFLKYHPGRKAQLMRGAGNDCTVLFDKLHTWVNEETILKGCLVGFLTPGKAGPVFDQCVVKSIETVTHNAKVFTLRRKDGSLFKTPIGYHVKVQARIEGSVVEREYTPISALDDYSPDLSQEELVLMIKMYPHGQMTRHLAEISTGDSLHVSEPLGSFDETKLTLAKKLILIAAGSGFTPMIKLLCQKLHENKNFKNTEKCSITLLLANKTEEDILWKDKLEELEASSPELKVVHILSSPSDSWRGERGRVSYSFLQRYLPSLSSVSSESEVFVCVSGPTAFAGIVGSLLFNMKYPDDIIHSFD